MEPLNKQRHKAIKKALKKFRLSDILWYLYLEGYKLSLSEICRVEMGDSILRKKLNDPKISEEEYELNAQQWEKK